MAFRCYKTASSDLSRLAPLFQAFVQGFLVVLLVSCGAPQLVQIFWGMNWLSGGEQYNYLMCLYEQKGEQSNYFTCLYKLAFHTSYCICLFFCGNDVLAHVQFVLPHSPCDPYGRNAAVFSSVVCLCRFLPPNDLQLCPSSLSPLPSLSGACQIPILASKAMGVMRRF